jgi:RING finger protein 113A
MNIQFKKRNISKNNNIREKKDEDIDNNDDDEKTIIIRPDNNKKRSAAGRDNDDDTKQVLGSSVTTVFESTKQLVSQKYSGDATYTTEVDTALDRDARAILERNIKLQDAGILESEPNVYRGQSAYKSYAGKKDMAQVGANKFTGTQGPLRAPAFLRASCRFDYAPDICKDYKETGFCGYGDSCKFLHDRGDYKSGWQLAKEWDEEQAKKKKRLAEAVSKLENVDDEDGSLLDAAVKEGDKEENYEIEEEDEELPFACFICRDDFNQPVVTLCGHYFCSPCAFESNKKSSKCPVCDKQTHGIFNKAKKLIKKLIESGKMNEEDVSTVKVTTTSKRGSWEEITD